MKSEIPFFKMTSRGFLCFLQIITLRLKVKIIVVGEKGKADVNQKGR